MSGVDEAYERLVAAIDAEPDGGEARYLARLVLLLLEQADYAPEAMALIEDARSHHLMATVSVHRT
jgi:hypothetical protein